jgi:hypothetical protein
MSSGKYHARSEDALPLSVSILKLLKSFFFTLK